MKPCLKWRLTRKRFGRRVASLHSASKFLGGKFCFGAKIWKILFCFFIFFIELCFGDFYYYPSSYHVRGVRVV